MKQSMMPDRSLFYAGDIVTFRLELKNAPAGEGRLRTDLERACVLRQEAVSCTEAGRMSEGAAWHDIPMPSVSRGVFEVKLPLLEVGVFQAKCCFVPADGGRILWPDGENFRIKVESAGCVAGNSIYCAFVRQFGPDCGVRCQVPCGAETLVSLDHAGYTVIPPSGTFRAVVRRLDHIFHDLGFRILQLLPIHPVPTVYGRMGRYGSPFAALDYFAIDPALAEFDRNVTVLEQFMELVDAVHARHGRIFLDIPVNHTGWGSKLQSDHPEYFVRHADGRFESPGAWGVTWEDLCRLNYGNPSVIRLMAEVFLYWCRIGVDGFRCDAGYMLPQTAWTYIVSRVRQEYPDTVFLLEGLGGPIDVQEKLLAESGIDWAYSELFQVDSREGIANYLPYIEKCSSGLGTLVNFAETHDNERLASKSRRYAAMRCALTALFAEDGAFGITNGVEFFAAERVNVHEASALNWGATPNLIPWLRRLNTILTNHPAFATRSRLRLIQCDPGCFVVGCRESADGVVVLLLINLDCQSRTVAQWTAVGCKSGGGEWVDLLSGEHVMLECDAMITRCSLEPGECRCLSPNATDLDMIENAEHACGEPSAAMSQRSRQAGYKVRRFFHSDPFAGEDPGAALRKNPYEFAAKAAGSDVPGVVRYRVGRDERRLVMMCPGDLLLFECERHFMVTLRHENRTLDHAVSLPLEGHAGEFAFVFAGDAPAAARELDVQIVSYEENRTVHRSSGRILQLTAWESVRWQYHFSGNAVRTGEDVLALAASCMGGMTMMHAAWGELRSKYDAILAANGKAPYPVDRRVMFTRCRAWLVSEEYSQKIDVTSLVGFAGGDNRAEWRFTILSGQGKVTPIKITMEGALDRDAVRLIFTRPSNGSGDQSSAVTLILRPDLEDRLNHQVTKAFVGPEVRFPAAVAQIENGICFAPSPEHALSLQLSGADFVKEPEWEYMVNLQDEEYYGLDHCTDLFSPGYFRFTLSPGESRTLFASVGDRSDVITESSCTWPDDGKDFGESKPPQDALRRSLRYFVARRDESRTVIAGYPWFLDWGRDTLIALRGLIRAGWRNEVRDILRVFASFEEKGTIPNMIHGHNVGNRDTSDAPLWLLLAAGEYVDFYGDDALLDMDCGGRTLFRVLQSIVAHYRIGTPNGIRVDPESGLVFSPRHFTWMDTNFPAGTPREGYPIEIQALWIAALRFLGRRDQQYLLNANQAAESLKRLFFCDELNRFSDCLHAASGTSAADAVPDDHVRPNQLLALTLGAVDAQRLRLSILDSAAELLVPGAVRSLSDRRTEYKMPIIRDGALLNNPDNPYCGHYRGPEDTSRKIAYHNGTAWCWLFPSYCEGLYLVGGEEVRSRALSLLGGSAYAADRGIPGMLPEIMDGDFPHRSGGCPAQAWSVTEAFRVYDILKS